MKTIFVTGTDTGVGKTLVSRLLIDHFVALGEKVSPMKPVASGAEVHDGKLVNDDAQILLSASNTDCSYEMVNPYVFEAPIAPHVAAEKDRVTIDTHVLNQNAKTLAESADRVIIEGAGGWQVPLTREVSFADWVSENNWPVVLVVGLRLGCINHARLTELDIYAKKNKLLGWVANTIDPDLAYANEIVNDLADMIDAPLLGVIPWLQELDSVQTYLDFTRLPDQITRPDHQNK